MTSLLGLNFRTLSAPIKSPVCWWDQTSPQRPTSSLASYILLRRQVYSGGEGWGVGGEGWGWGVRGEEWGWGVGGEGWGVGGWDQIRWLNTLNKNSILLHNTLAPHSLCLIRYGRVDRALLEEKEHRYRKPHEFSASGWEGGPFQLPRWHWSENEWSENVSRYLF